MTQHTYATFHTGSSNFKISHLNDPGDGVMVSTEVDFFFRFGVYCKKSMFVCL